MKAVILERRGENAAVLAENGTFIKVRQAGDVGEEIEIKEQSAPIRIWRSGAAKFLTAAAIVLALIGGSYHYMAVSVSAYVSIDAGESSVEMTVNRLGKVTSVRPVAETSAELAKALNVSVSGMSVEDAVNAALDTITDSGKTVSDEEPVIVGITSESEGQAQSLENAIANNAELPVRTVRVSENEREEAHDRDIGGGAYVLGTEDAVAEPPETEDKTGDIAPATTTAETKVIPVFVTEMQETTAEELPPVTESNITDAPADMPREQPDVTVSPERQPEAPQQSEQLPDSAPQDIPAMRNNAAPAPTEGEQPPQNERQSDDMSPEPPAEQSAGEQSAPAPAEGEQPPQNGQQPDNMPPAQPGEKNGQEAGMTMPGDNMPQEQPSAMSGTAAPPAMPAPDTFGQR